MEKLDALVDEIAVKDGTATFKSRYEALAQALQKLGTLNNQIIKCPVSYQIGAPDTNYKYLNMRLWVIEDQPFLMDYWPRIVQSSMSPIACASWRKLKRSWPG